MKGYAMLLAYLPALIFEAFLEMMNEPLPRQMPERARDCDNHEGDDRHRSCS
jgi:hypothetical protein